jgi:hypothetical protein
VVLFVLSRILGPTNKKLCFPWEIIGRRGTKCIACLQSHRRLSLEFWSNFGFEGTRGEEVVPGGGGVVCGGLFEGILVRLMGRSKYRERMIPNCGSNFAKQSYAQLGIILSTMSPLNLSGNLKSSEKTRVITKHGLEPKAWTNPHHEVVREIFV